LKNPFNSIHAVALINLGELTSGLLTMNMLKTTGKKGIVTEINSKYHKKARGKVTAVCKIENLDEGLIKSILYDDNQEIVCEVFCKWNIKTF